MDKRQQGLDRPRLHVERRRQSREDERRRHWFADEEWKSLVALKDKEADAANRSNTAVADATDNVAGGLLMENKMIGGESGAVFLNHSTVRLTSTSNPVPGKQQFCLVPSETIVGQVKKIRSLTQGID